MSHLLKFDDVVAPERGVDPPPEAMPIAPDHHKLLARLAFFSRWMTFISPRSQLSGAIADRLQVLRNLGDVSQLDSVPLVRSDGEPFKLEVNSQSGTLPSFFNGRSKVVKEGVGGSAFVIGQNLLAFVGLRQSVLPLLADQRFQAIRSFRVFDTSAANQFEVVLRRSEHELLRSDSTRWHEVGANHLRAVIAGTLHCSASGFAFAFLRA